MEEGKNREDEEEEKNKSECRARKKRTTTNKSRAMEETTDKQTNGANMCKTEAPAILSSGHQSICPTRQAAGDKQAHCRDTEVNVNVSLRNLSTPYQTSLET